MPIPNSADGDLLSSASAASGTLKSGPRFDLLKSGRELEIESVLLRLDPTEILKILLACEGPPNVLGKKISQLTKRNVNLFQDVLNPGAQPNWIANLESALHMDNLEVQIINVLLHFNPDNELREVYPVEAVETLSEGNLNKVKDWLSQCESLELELILQNAKHVRQRGFHNGRTYSALPSHFFDKNDLNTMNSANLDIGDWTTATDYERRYLADDSAAFTNIMSHLEPTLSRASSAPNLSFNAAFGSLRASFRRHRPRESTSSRQTSAITRPPS